jgi:hypothetical protein
MKRTITVEKDEENQLPIPTVWRPTFAAIVSSFVKKDYRLTVKLDYVSSVSNETANHIRDYIEEYGEELVQLSEETWESSACIWMGAHWDVLIDLRTAGEGRSDLVLGAKVTESADSYIVNVEMVHVP